MGGTGWNRERRRALILRAGRKSRRSINRILAKYSLVGDPEVFDPRQFSWTAELEEHWEDIRKEAERLLQLRDYLPPLHQISPDHQRITHDAGWKSYILYGYGLRSDRSCERCPETTRLLEKVPGLETAFFSILSPGKHIPRHRGVTKAIITCHLALMVPRERDRCVLRIGDRAHSWREGETLIFDDTNRHEVCNATDDERVVLLIHFRRPLRFPGSLVASSLLRTIQWSPFIQDARKNQAAWEDDFEARLRRTPFRNDASN